MAVKMETERDSVYVCVIALLTSARKELSRHRETRPCCNRRHATSAESESDYSSTPGKPSLAVMTASETTSLSNTVT